MTEGPLWWALEDDVVWEDTERGQVYLEEEWHG